MKIVSRERRYSDWSFMEIFDSILVGNIFLSCYGPIYKENNSYNIFVMNKTLIVESTEAHI